MKKNSIAFIGAGKMASAIASGLHEKRYPAQISAYDPNPAAAEHFASVSGGKTFSSAKKALESADIVFLCVKPQYLAEAVKGLQDAFKGKLIVSIVAGFTIEKIASLTGNKQVVRVMPNTPALAGEGMSCIAPAPGTGKEDAERVLEIFSSVGKALIVPETQFDAVTGLSGSGPAYVLEFIQSLADGGVYMGLPRDTAVALAVQTVLGTAKLASCSGRSVMELRNDVISPGGTTSRGSLALADGKFHSAVAHAVIEGARYSAILGKK